MFISILHISKTIVTLIIDQKKIQSFLNRESMIAAQSKQIKKNKS